jgi:hypothetical protein
VDVGFCIAERSKLLYLPRRCGGACDSLCEWALRFDGGDEGYSEHSLGFYGHHSRLQYHSDGRELASSLCVGGALCHYYEQSVKCHDYT